MIAAPFTILQSTCTYILDLDDKTKNNAYTNILCVVIYSDILFSYIKNFSPLIIEYILPILSHNFHDTY